MPSIQACAWIIQPLGLWGGLSLSNMVNSVVHEAFKNGHGLNLAFVLCSRDVSVLIGQLLQKREG